MSASLAIHHEVQPYDVGLSADYPRLPAAIEGEGNAAVFKSAAGVSPDHRERAETRLSGWNVNPRTSAQFVSIRQPYTCSASDILIHQFPLFHKPARCTRDSSVSSKPVQTPGGGNLARVQSTRAGLFLFPTQSAQQFKADFPDPNEARDASPLARGAGAAINRSAAQSAKSRPLPLSFQHFIKINHVSHVALLSDWDRSPEPFAHLQKGFAA